MNKLIISLTLFTVLTGSALAATPKELLGLIPSGRNDIRFVGKTPDHKNCIADVSIAGFGYSAVVVVLDSFGHDEVIANFQLGLGHELQSFKIEGNNLVTVAFHEAEESYSGDKRSTLKVNVAGKTVHAVHVTSEEKKLFGYKTVASATCLIK